MVENVNCVIADDDPKAIDLIRSLIGKIPGLHVEAEFTDSLLARDYLFDQLPDLLFLDIEMPNLKGTELLRLLPNPPATIFLTAHEQFALEAHELHVVDFLLKPVPFDRFLKAVEYAKKEMNKAVQPLPEVMDDYIPIKVEGGNFLIVPAREINYLAARKDETMISLVPGSERGKFLGDRKDEKFLLAKMGIGEIERRLSQTRFFRTHRSYIVALDRIVKVDKGGELITLSIPLGKSISITPDNRGQLFAILGWLQ